MFQNKRYVTRGIAAELSMPMQLLLWYLIDSMETEQKDWLQVFTLEPEDGKQKIVHTQEEPPYGDALDKYFHLGKNLNQRDTIAVRKMVGGFIKLVYPDGEYTKEQLEEILKLSLEMRRRVKEQLKKLGGMEFYDVKDGSRRGKYRGTRATDY